MAIVRIFIKRIVKIVNMEKTLKYIIYALIVGVFISCLFIFKSWIFPYITSKTIPFRILVELLFFFYLILALKETKYRPKRSWILYSLLIFSVIAIITSILGINPKLSFVGDLERMWGINTWVHLILFFIIVSSVLRTKKEWFVFLNISLVFCSYIAIYGYLQRWGISWIFRTGITRIESVLGNSAYAAGILLLGTILSFYFLIKKQGFWRRFLYIIHIIIQLPAMFLAEIRGAQVAFLFCLLLVLIVFIFRSNPHTFGKVVEIKKKYIKIGLISFLILVILFFSIAFVNKDKDWVKSNSILGRFTSMSFKEGTVRTRLISWEGGLKALQSRPIMGYGMENYYYAFDKYFQADYYNIAPTETWFDRAHNMVMENLVAHGVFGLLSYLSIFIIILVYLYKIYKKDPEQNWLFSLFFGSLVIAYFIQNIFVFDSLAVTTMFFFILAYINFKYNETFGKEVVFKRQLSEFGIFIIFIISGILVIYFIFGINTVHAKVAHQNYIVQKGLYQDNDFNKTFDKVKKLYSLNSYLNKDSLTMITDTIMKVYSKAKDDKEQIKAVYNITNFLIKQLRYHLEINDKEAYMQLNLARLYMLRANFFKPDDIQFKESLDLAKQVIKKCIELSPERLHNYYFMSRIDAALGDYGQAIEDLETALDYNDKYAETYLYLARVYKQIGDKDKYDEYSEKAYSLKPSLKD